MPCLPGCDLQLVTRARGRTACTLTSSPFVAISPENTRSWIVLCVTRTCQPSASCHTRTPGIAERDDPGSIRARRRRGCRAGRSRPARGRRRGRPSRSRRRRDRVAAVVTSRAAASCRSFMMFLQGVRSRYTPTIAPSCEEIAKPACGAREHAGMDLSGLEAEATARLDPAAAAYVNRGAGRRRHTARPTSRPGAACGCGPHVLRDVAAVDTTAQVLGIDGRGAGARRADRDAPPRVRRTPNGATARAAAAAHTVMVVVDGIVGPARGDRGRRARRAALRPDVRAARSGPHPRDGRSRARRRCARDRRVGRRRGRAVRARHAARSRRTSRASSTTSTRR